ncbi:MAG: hypothetical protein FJ395_18245 [Verrucomicrobia bacterium]|nr:hypothetical protein [Verrucomicrobiota bacterium]
MIKTLGANPLFLFPDPLTHINQLSGACFLYFERPVCITPPPAVVTQEAFQLPELVEARRPEWGGTYFNILNQWMEQQRQFKLAIDLLTPLKEKGYCASVYLAYPANNSAIERVDDMLAAAGLSIQDAARFARLPEACSELVRHIHLECFLEANKDIEQLYQHCGNILKLGSIEDLLLKCYLLRPSSCDHFRSSGAFSLLLTNHSLLELFGRMPVEQPKAENLTKDLVDIAGWEIFWRLISPHLDPMTPDDVASIIEIREKKADESKKLRSRCGTLAEQLDLTADHKSIVAQIDRLVRADLSPQIATLLELDQKALRDFLVEVFGDEVTWLACAGAVGGLLSGTLPLTAGAAVAAMSNLGAKAFKVAADRRQKLKESDYTLIYSLSNR